MQKDHVAPCKAIEVIEAHVAIVYKILMLSRIEINRKLTQDYLGNEA